MKRICNSGIRFSWGWRRPGVALTIYVSCVTPVPFSSPSQAWETSILPTTASVYFPSAGRGKYWFGDKLLPYPRRKPSSFTLGFGRRNFKKMESLVVLMWTFRLGLLPEGGNEKTGGCHFIPWASQHKFRAKNSCYRKACYLLNYSVLWHTHRNRENTGNFEVTENRLFF